MRVEGVTPTGPFPTSGSANVTVEDGTGALTLRVDGTTGITTADEPEAPFDLVGIFTQFDPALPLTEGYQVLPRSAADLGASAPGACTATTLTESDPYAGDDRLGRVDLTFENPDGIARLAFTKFENFALGGVDPAPSSQEETGGRPTLGFGSAPRAIGVTLRQADGQVAGAAYFAVASSLCPGAEDGLLRTDFDPPVGFTAAPPDALELAGSYPNPTRGAAKIEYGLPEAGEVRLAVYDALGRRVATLAAGPRPAGRHQIRWDGRSGAGARLASGLYFVRLEAGGQVRTRQLTIVR